MRKVVEKVGRTYEEAVDAALTELGIPRERAEVVLVQARDADRSRPGPEEYLVRAWERDPAEAAAPTEAPDLNVPSPAPFVCERSAPSFDEAVRACLESLGITQDQADIQVLQREDTNPLKPGPEKVTVRVWRRHRTEPAPNPAEIGAEHINDIHAAAHLPEDSELSFEGGAGANTEETP